MFSASIRSHYAHRVEKMAIETHPEALQGRHLPNGLGIANKTFAAGVLD